MKYEVWSMKPLWGHRSISIDSDFGPLQPYFLVVMVTVKSPFIACMQLRDNRSRDAVDALKRPSFCRKSWRFEPPKLRFPSSARPTVELYAVLVLVSGLLSWEWTVCQRSTPAAFQKTAWFGRLSFDLRGLCLAGEGWKFVRDLDNLRCNAGRNTLCGFGAIDGTYSSWWLLFETIFGKPFSVPRTFGFVFRDQWEKSFQTR